MAGNILYIPFSIIIIAGAIGFGALIGMKRGKKAFRNFLMLVLPVVALIQLYFWNGDFNNYIKGFIFSSEVYECTYIEDLRNITIPLPDRTVLQGREDVCSPFYLTYMDKKPFRNFFNQELSKLKSTGKIEDFYLIEPVGGMLAEYVARVPSGATINIAYKSQKYQDTPILAISYHP